MGPSGTFLPAGVHFGKRVWIWHVISRRFLTSTSTFWGLNSKVSGSIPPEKFFRRTQNWQAAEQTSSGEGTTRISTPTTPLPPTVPPLATPPKKRRHQDFGPRCGKSRGVYQLATGSHLGRHLEDTLDYRWQFFGTLPSFLPPPAAHLPPKNRAWETRFESIFNINPG